jgi:hypothetical protein
MRRSLSIVSLVLGVGTLVWGLSAYSPSYGWSDSCRLFMATGSMLIAGGWMTR